MHARIECLVCVGGCALIWRRLAAFAELSFGGPAWISQCLMMVEFYSWRAIVDACLVWHGHFVLWYTDAILMVRVYARLV